MTLALSISLKLLLIDDARVVIYDRHMFMVQATDVRLSRKKCQNKRSSLFEFCSVTMKTGFYDVETRSSRKRETPSWLRREERGRPTGSSASPTAAETSWKKTVWLSSVDTSDFGVRFHCVFTKFSTAFSLVFSAFSLRFRKLSLASEKADRTKILCSGPNVIKLFTVVIYKCSQ